MYHSNTRNWLLLPLAVIALLILPYAFAQETQAGIQGVVKDPSGAVLSKAVVEVTGAALIGSRSSGETDSSGAYRFSHLPPGDYTLTVTAPGFRSYKQVGIRLDVGRMPTIDITLNVGTASETVEVSGQAPIVDVTTSKTAVNIPREQIDNLPKGRSFQTLIPFAPGARQEPMQGSRDDRGRQNGFQIDGASDSENVYLVEGLNTTNIQDGGIGFNVPMEFIQEVQIKSSGFEAEFGGATGGVINVVQKRGGNSWHGSIFTKYTTDAANATDQCINLGPRTLQQILCGLRVDPTGPSSAGQRAEYYNQKKDHRRIVEPGFEIGGPLFKDRLWLFSSFVPTIDRDRRQVNFTGKNPGLRTFQRTFDQYNALNRLDGLVYSKLRVFGSWQYAYARTSGISLPNFADSVTGQINTAASSDPTSIRTDRGQVLPAAVYTFGGDWTPTSKLVISARYGYFFNNFHDVGIPVGIRYLYDNTLNASSHTTTGAVINQAFANPAGFQNFPSNAATVFDAYKRKAFSTDASYFIGRFLGGTHNFKFGYGFNQQSNDVLNSANNTALVYMDWDKAYSPGTPDGIAACAALTAANGSCRGTVGYVTVQDGVDVVGKVSAYNHAIYGQDTWTIKGLTINAGVRLDSEFLPPYRAGALKVSFSFLDKVAPRIGVAYDVLHNGKLKVYGSYGKFFDIMKFGLPRGSFGGDYWHDCVYALNDPNFNLIVPTSPGGHACGDSGPAPGVAPNSGAVGAFIENHNWRKNLLDPNFPGLDPNIKPESQHEYVAGTDWAISPSVGLEVRYARKRLDRTIEDIGITDDLGFYIGNPGTVYGQVLQRLSAPDSGIVGDTPHPAECPDCKRDHGAVRRYDGLEFRLTKRGSSRWFASASYTYSKLEGNYTGQTDTDITDGQGGRHSPNNHRAFDNPQMQWTAHGTLVDGPLPTDRPHTLKLFGWYRLKWFKGQETTIGLEQQAYSGTPISTCWNALATASSCVFVENRGNFVKLHEVDTIVGGTTVATLVSDGVTRGARTPVFTQTDMSLVHEIKVSKTNENMRLAFEVNAQNLLNQRATMAVWENPLPTTNAVFPPSTTTPSQVNWHAFTDTGWNYIGITNGTSGNFLSALYGKPAMFQLARNMRFKIRFSF